MKRMMAFVFAMALILGLSGLALAQDDAAAPKAEKAEKFEKAEKGAKGFKSLDANGDGKVTKDEFMAAAQKRAAARWEKLDPTGKGYLTKDDFIAAHEKNMEKYKNRKTKTPAAQQ